MKSLICVLSVFLSTQSFSFWGAPKLASEEIRSKTYEVNHKYKQVKAYKKTLIFMARTFTDANQTIKVKDKDLGMILAKGNLPCEALNLGSGYGKDQMVEFSLEVTSEDNKTEINITKIIGKSNGAFDNMARPSTQKEADAAFEQCITPFVNKIIKSLK